jgi:lipoprotein-anchoring transpeptidase ErfK/SrfK
MEYRTGKRKRDKALALAIAALATAPIANAQEAGGGPLTLETINGAILDGDGTVVTRPCQPAFAVEEPQYTGGIAPAGTGGDSAALESDIEAFLEGGADGQTANGEPVTSDIVVAEPQVPTDTNVPAKCGAPSSAPAETNISGKKASALVTRVQVALDRAGVSNGVIDGLDGENFRKAVRVFEQVNNLDIDGKLDHAMTELLFGVFGDAAMVQYTITEADVAGPFIKAVPEDYGEKAKLESLAYTSVTEMLAERFHMDEKFLKKINSQAEWNVPGTVITVAQPEEPIDAGSVSRIVIDGKAGSLMGYDADGNFKVYYPATVGSPDTPSPSGTHTVERIAPNPGYTYNPKINFKQGNNDKILHLPSGPNGPVGSMWIALSKPSYGIHGTPEPSKIAKTNSHGCVRLTNWDAAELSKLVHQGTVVEFAGTRDDPAIAEPETPSGAIEMPAGEEPLAPAAPADGG